MMFLRKFLLAVCLASLAFAAKQDKVTKQEKKEARKMNRSAWKKMIKGLKGKIDKDLIKKIKNQKGADKKGDFCGALCKTDAGSEACQECCIHVNHRVDWMCDEPQRETKPSMKPLCAEIKERDSCDQNCLYAFSTQDLFPLIPDDLVKDLCSGENGKYTALCPSECPDQQQQKAACCTEWSAECYTDASEANNNHACNECYGYGRGYGGYGRGYGGYRGGYGGYSRYGRRLEEAPAQQ